jgi:WD40 repeat protein
MGKWLLLGGCGLLLLVSGIIQSQQAMAQSPTITPTLNPSGSPPVITPDNVANLALTATLSRGIADRVFWAEDGQHLIVASASGFWLHDMDDLQARPRQIGQPGSVLYSAVMSADRKTLAWAHERRGSSMDVATGQISASVTELGYEGSSVTSVTLSPDSSLLVANAQSVGLYLVDRNGQTKSPHFYAPYGFITPYAEAVSPDNRLLVVADNDKLHMWHTEDFAPADLNLPVDGALSVSFNQDGTRLAVGYEDGSIAIGDLASHNPYVKLLGRRSPLGIVTFAPQANLLVGAHANGAVELWRPDTGELLLTVDARGEPGNVVFSPDGTLLAVDASWYPEQSQTQLWDITSGTRRAVWKGATHPAFRPDGKLAATINKDTVYGIRRRGACSTPWVVTTVI